MCARHFWSIIAIAFSFSPIRVAHANDARTDLRVMTFNLWHGGDAGKKPLERTVEVIRVANADIVGLQETGGISEQDPPPDNAAKIAKSLGWHYVDQGQHTVVISRFPIVSTTPRKWGVTIELPSSRRVHVFNVHFNHAPYQPYQLLGIPYADAPFIKTADEAVAEAKAARGDEVTRLLSELTPALKGTDPVFVTGDFNEPSHLDWTPAAAEAKRCPLAVDWPTTRGVMAAGLIDALRTLRPDPVKDPCCTWTPITQPSDPKDRHDRIDFVLTSCRAEQVLEAKIVGERPDAADIVVADYPSDHRAVVVRVRLDEKGK
jgi:exodeoxyribonuclease III